MEENKKFTTKQMIVLMCIPTVVFLILTTGYFIHQDNVSSELKRQQEEYERNRAGIVADSLREVNAQKAVYFGMVQFISNMDSARKSQRYKSGDIVYLKPDSIKAVVSEVVFDSSMFNHTYILILNNNFGMPNICEKKDKLIF